MIVAANRQVLEALHARVMRPDLIIVIVEILNYRILMIRIRVTKGKVLQSLVEAVAVLVVVPCRFDYSSAVHGHR